MHMGDLVRGVQQQNEGMSIIIIMAYGGRWDVVVSCCDVYVYLRYIIGCHLDNSNRVSAQNYFLLLERHM